MFQQCGQNALFFIITGVECNMWVSMSYYYHLVSPRCSLHRERSLSGENYNLKVVPSPSLCIKHPSVDVAITFVMTYNKQALAKERCSIITSISYPSTFNTSLTCSDNIVCSRCVSKSCCQSINYCSIVRAKCYLIFAIKGSGENFSGVLGCLICFKPPTYNFSVKFSTNYKETIRV